MHYIRSLLEKSPNITKKSKNNGERAILHKLQTHIKINNIYFDLNPSQFYRCNDKIYKIFIWFDVQRELGGGV